jgi:hypothetical protein
MSDQTYICPKCNKQVTVKEGQSIPRCCGQTMEPLPFCTKAPADPEMARLNDADEPCDDGTKGGRR